jgi:hypothetical protein
MVREKPVDQRCQYECGQKIDGRGAWQYCSACRKAALKEVKKERDRKYSAKRRKDDREKGISYPFLYYNGLTEPQLRPLFDCAEAKQEDEPHSKDEGYEYA